jgi:hypothetical protein
MFAFPEASLPVTRNVCGYPNTGPSVLKSRGHSIEKYELASSVLFFVHFNNNTEDTFRLSFENAGAWDPKKFFPSKP